MSSSKDFWGLILEPCKRHKGVLKQDLHVTRAAVDVSRIDDNDSIQVMVSVADNVTKFLICTLNKKICQVAIDLHFLKGQTVKFMCNGKGYVHLTGYLEDPFAESDELKCSTEEDKEGEKETSLKKKENLSKKDIQKSSKKKAGDDDENCKKINSDVTEDEYYEDYTDYSDSEHYVLDDDYVTDDDEKTEEEDDDEDDYDFDYKNLYHDYLYDNYDCDDDEDDIEMNESKNDMIEQKKSEDQKMTKAKVTGKESKEKPKNKNVKIKKKKSNEEIVMGNVIASNVEIGTGPVAELGKNVTIYYRSRVKLGKKTSTIEECLEGDGFSFQVGSGRVLPGVNAGIIGMKVGGKRSLIIPPEIAYGVTGCEPNIPPYAIILYDIELLKVS